MKKILVTALKFYKKHISPVFLILFGSGCRFSPTCSDYTIQAVEKFGSVKGLTLGFKRFMKCHPFGEFGYDPVPER